MEQGSVEGAIRAVLGLGNRVLERENNASWNEDNRHDAAVFSYQRDFTFLWGLNSGTLGLNEIAGRLIASRKGKAVSLVIIWDEIPTGKSDAVNTSRYITPLDWAVALSLTIHQLSPDQKGYPALRIIIVDPASHRADYADCLSLLPHLRLSMPWISLCQPAGRVPGAMDIDRLFVDIFDVGGKLAGGVPTMCDAARDGHTDPELIRRIWASFLSKPSTTDDHHAISNLLGPQLLLGETARTTDSTVQALRCVMLTAGLLPSDPKSKKEALLTDTLCWMNLDEHPAWKTTIEKLAGGRLKLILVDDQWQDGWGEVLCKAVGVSLDEKARSEDQSLIKISQGGGSISVHAASSPTVILEKLEQSWEDRRFTLRLDDSEPDAAEVLFLDLRLFSGSSTSGEADFIERCLKLARKIMADRGDRLPWAGFFEDELGRIETWIAKAKDPKGGDSRAMPEYAEALTLFSRIIAQIDLSLPIVLFTSTGRRDIMKAFDGYGSIICEFEKPRMVGTLADDLATRAKEQFVAAVMRALEFLDARLVCQQILGFPPLHRPQRPSKPPVSHWTIDLYVDESGSGIDDKTGLQAPGMELKVGGLLVIFPPGADPDSFNSDLLRHMKKVIGPYLIKEVIRKNAELLSDWVQNRPNSNRPKHVSLVTLSAKMPALEDADDGSGYLELSHVGDNLHRDLMAHVVDFSIYHLALREIPSSDKVSCRIHLPTRVLPIGTLDTTNLDNLFNTLGIQTKFVGTGSQLWEAQESLARYPTLVATIGDQIKESALGEPQKKIHYFNFNDARALVMSVANNYRYASFRPMMDHARAYGINDLGHVGSPGGPKALHILMDAVLSANSGGQEINQIIERGANGVLDYPMMAMIHAARMHSGEHFAEALVAMAEAFEHQHPVVNDGIAKILGGEIRDAAERINGLGYMSFIDIRKERMGYGKAVQGAKKLLTGYVRKKTANYCEISDGASGICNFYHGRRCSIFPSLGVGDKVEYYAARGYLPGERVVTRITTYRRHPVWDLLKDQQRIIIGKICDISDDYRGEVEICGFRGEVKLTLPFNNGDYIYFRATTVSKKKRKYQGEQIILESTNLDKSKVLGCGWVTGVDEKNGGWVSLPLAMGGLIPNAKITGGRVPFGKGEQVLVEVLGKGRGNDRRDLGLLNNLSRW